MKHKRSKDINDKKKKTRKRIIHMAVRIILNKYFLKLKSPKTGLSIVVLLEVDKYVISELLVSIKDMTTF